MTANRLSLTGRETRQLRDAQSLLLSPLDHVNGNEWCAAIARQCKTLLDADKVTFIAPVKSSRYAFSEGVSQVDQGAFPKLVHALDAMWSMWNRQAQLGAWTRRSVWGRWMNSYLHTPYYNEFVVPRGLFDAVGLSANSGTSAGADSTATLWLHHDRPNGGRFGRRGLQILQQLFPAFSAGITMLAKFDAHRASFVRVLDDLGIPLLIASNTGQHLHRTPVLSQMLAEEPDAAALLGEIAQMAGGLSRILSLVPSLTNVELMTPLDAVAREVDTRTARYRLRASSSGPELLGSGPLVLVLVERVTPMRWSVDELRERCGLTESQAHVAALIGEGLSYEVIADRRGISPHTVRRHAEQVRSKLGVHSATAIAAVLANRIQRNFR